MASHQFKAINTRRFAFVPIKAKDIKVQTLIDIQGDGKMPIFVMSIYPDMDEGFMTLVTLRYHIIKIPLEDDVLVFVNK